ncbi:hypothetical protein E4U54_003734, partial [Claviceps lovelessii]
TASMLRLRLGLLRSISSPRRPFSASGHVHHKSSARSRGIQASLVRTSRSRDTRLLAVRAFQAPTQLGRRENRPGLVMPLVLPNDTSPSSPASLSLKMPCHAELHVTGRTYSTWDVISNTSPDMSVSVPRLRGLPL